MMKNRKIINFQLKFIFIDSNLKQNKILSGFYLTKEPTNDRAK